MCVHERVLEFSGTAKAEGCDASGPESDGADLANKVGGTVDTVALVVPPLQRPNLRSFEHIQWQLVSLHTYRFSPVN